MQFAGSVDQALIAVSASTVEQALMPEQFSRLFDDATTGTPVSNYHSYLYGEDSLPWKIIFDFAAKLGAPVDASPLRLGSGVYDWRLSVPALMQLIALRIQLLAAADLTLRKSVSKYAGDFLHYKASLEDQMKMMGQGVQCTHVVRSCGPDSGCKDSGTLFIACADKNTGENVVEGIRRRDFPAYPFDRSCHDLNAWSDDEGYLIKFLRCPRITIRDQLNAFIEAHEFTARTQITDKMPFSELYGMVKSLNLLAFNSPATPDGAFIREAAGTQVYIIEGRARFPVEETTDLEGFYWLDRESQTGVQDMAVGTLQTLGIVPVDGTLLGEFGRQDVFMIRGGKKTIVPGYELGTELAFHRAGLNSRYVRTVPSGSTAWMPTADWDTLPIVFAGDLNADGTIDCVDQGIIKASFGKRENQLGFDSRADTNADGIVDVRDLAFVSQKLSVGCN